MTEEEDTFWRMPIKPDEDEEEFENPDIIVYIKKLRLPTKQFKTEFRTRPRTRYCDNSLDKRGFKRGHRDSEKNSMNWSKSNYEH